MDENLKAEQEIRRHWESKRAEKSNPVENENDTGDNLRLKSNFEKIQQDRKKLEEERIILAQQKKEFEEEKIQFKKSQHELFADQR